MGLALVEPGVEYAGALTMFNSEEQVLWEYNKYSADSYTLHVRDFVRCLSSIEMQEYICGGKCTASAKAVAEGGVASLA